MDDLNPVTRDFGSMQPTMFSGNYTVNYNSGLQLTAGINHTAIQSASIENTLSGLSLGVGKNVPEKCISINLNTNLNSSYIDGNLDGLVVNTGLLANFKIKEKHQLRANVFWQKTSSKQFDSFSDVMIQFGYNYTIR